MERDLRQHEQAGKTDPEDERKLASDTVGDAANDEAEDQTGGGRQRVDQAEEFEAEAAFQHIKIEEQIPTAQDQAVDEHHDQEQARGAVEASDGCNVVLVQALQHICL